MKYYMVMCSRGHCGSGHSTEIKFAIRAKNLLDAMDKAKRMPSVKHTRAILHGYEINEQEYVEYRQISAYKREGQSQQRAIRRR